MVVPTVDQGVSCVPGVEYHLCVHINGIPLGVWMSHPVISYTTEAFAVSAWPVAQNCPTAIRMGSIMLGRVVVASSRAVVAYVGVVVVAAASRTDGVSVEGVVEVGGEVGA